MNSDPIPDALSTVLETLHLRTAVYCRAELTSPWGLRIAQREVAAFHAVRRGTCWLRFEGSKDPLPLAGGDFVVFPSGTPHILADHPRRAAEEIEAVIRKKGVQCRSLIHGGLGAPTTLLCGHFGFDRSPVHPLFSMLPTMIHVPGEDGQPVEPLKATLELIARETAQEAPGSTTVLCRATDILFVQLLRAYIDRLGQQEQGWLRGLRDSRIARALVAIHQNPEQDWPIASLAGLAGQSRSVFCTRFTELVGESPHRYLTRWRVHRATQLLRDQEAPLKEIAERTGFKDEMTFSKAFKRHVGQPPAGFRRSVNPSAEN